MREKQKKNLTRLKKLLKTARTKAFLKERLDISDRTLYRYIDALSGSGCVVSRTGTGWPVKFLIQKKK